MNNTLGSRDEGKLLLIVEAANILEGKRTRPNEPGKNKAITETCNEPTVMVNNTSEHGSDSQY